jgi:hypothetical protein
MVWVVLAIAGTSIAALAIFRIASSYSQAGQNRQNQQEPGHDNNTPDQIETIPREQNPNYWSRTEERVQERWNKFINDIKRNDNDKVVVAIATIAIALFTGMPFFSNIFLFISAEKSADAAKKAAEDLIIVERPYIFMTTPKIVAGPNNSYRLEYALINYGRTPAILRFYTSQTYAKDRPQYPMKSVIWNGWEVLKPREGHQGKLFEITQKLGDKSPLFWIEIFYLDMFNYMHTSGFTFFYMEVSGKGEFVAIASEKYNYHRTEKLGNGEWHPKAGKPPVD